MLVVVQLRKIKTNVTNNNRPRLFFILLFLNMMSNQAYRQEHKDNNQHNDNKLPKTNR